MKPSIKILTMLLAAGLMIPAFTVAAQAAVVDPDETTRDERQAAAPQRLLGVFRDRNAGKQAAAKRSDGSGYFRAAHERLGYYAH